MSPLPVTVTTRSITFLVGDPYKPSFATVTGQGDNPNYKPLHLQSHFIRVIDAPHRSEAMTIQWLDDIGFIGYLMYPTPVAVVVVVVVKIRQGREDLDLFKMIFYFYRGESPLNHHLVNMFCPFSQHFKANPGDDKVRGVKLDK